MGIKYNQKQRNKRMFYDKTGDKTPFLNMHCGDEPCNSSLRVLYCAEKQMPKRKKKRKMKHKRPEYFLSLFYINFNRHEHAWRPNNPGKRGKLGTLEKFPKYKEDPPKKLVRNLERENYDGPIMM